jgi:hypothetical protein
MTESSQPDLLWDSGRNIITSVLPSPQPSLQHVACLGCNRRSSMFIHPTPISLLVLFDHGCTTLYPLCSHHLIDLTVTLNLAPESPFSKHHPRAVSVVAIKCAYMTFIKCWCWPIIVLREAHTCLMRSLGLRLLLNKAEQCPTCYLSRTGMPD